MKCDLSNEVKHKQIDFPGILGVIRIWVHVHPMAAFIHNLHQQVISNQLFPLKVSVMCKALVQFDDLLTLFMQPPSQIGYSCEFETDQTSTE